MTTRLSLIMLALTGSLILTTGAIQAEQGGAIYLGENSVLENTQRNVRDKNDTTLTPEDQNTSKRDIRITTHIRKMLVKDASLSVNAQNVKIISRNGRVTLRGPVESKAESKKLKKIAKRTRGVVRVNNQLEIIAP
ncbi:Transport-associated protein [Crenothrix polyspora]|uniref:Transport-associated protein n=1 Tax=Crenothrix polyspora TaxID=360316 RepID=A0A1R4HEH5_9GAMM|nr:BON domain-containing protein [Crenothrix polyspora]SJM94648.1 Transport-associated protein [Crenothrix polyspora]